MIGYPSSKPEAKKSEYSAWSQTISRSAIVYRVKDKKELRYTIDDESSRGYNGGGIIYSDSSFNYYVAGIHNSNKSKRSQGVGIVITNGRYK